MQALDEKYTKRFQQLYNLDRRYSDLLDTHQRVWDTEDEHSANRARLRERHERAESKLVDRMNDFAEQLPTRECQHFDKQYKAIHGYTSYAVCYHV